MKATNHPPIYCLSPLTRGLLNFVILTMPLWLFLAPFFGYESLAGYAPSHLLVSPSVTTAVCLLLSFAIFLRAATSRILIRNGLFFAPAKWKGMSLQSLKRVCLDADEKPRNLIFVFEVDGVEQQRTVRLAHISDLSLESLLTQIEKDCPGARVSLKIRDHIVNRSSRAGGLNDDQEVPYHRSVALHRLNEMLELRRKSLVTAWCWFWGAAGLALMPLTVATLMTVPYVFRNARTDHLMDSVIPPGSLLRVYGHWFEQTLNHTVSRPFEFVTESSHSSVALPLVIGLIFGGLLVMLCFGAFLPNRIQITPQAISLYSRRGRTRFAERTVRWSDLVSVMLHRPKNSASTDKWQIHLCCGTGSKPLKLNFAAFPGVAEQRAFIQAIEKYAPHSAIDSALLEYFVAPATKSYTELWLQSLSSAPKRERLAPLQPGHGLQSARYVISKKLAVGGQATAYLAEDVDRVALVLKEFVLPVYVDNEVRKQALEKFQRESQMLKELCHPRIVRLRDYFIEDHRAYLVLEHVQGRTLRQLVESQGPIGDELALRLVDQMCDILEYLHGLDPPLVHRDFTPDNLILGDNGELKLIDFDVARRSDTQARTSVVGKHSFIPPEQFRGKPTCQSDIYALGATLFYILTGQDPEPLTRSSLPRDFPSDHGDALREIIEHATELDQPLRFASASALRQCLPTVKIKVTEQVKELL